MAATTGRTATRPVIAGAGIKRGYRLRQVRQDGSAPLENPVHPAELLATIYHAFGIDPATIVYNHLNQPRELVKASRCRRCLPELSLDSIAWSRHSADGYASCTHHAPS